MTVGKVSNFNFSSAGKTVGRCNDSMTKMASGGYYAEGGHAKGGKWIQEAVQKPGSLRSSLHVKEGHNIPAAKLKAAADKPGITGKRARLAMTLKKMNHADGGPIREPATGETYPSRRAMMKHESMETPRMQRDEVIQSRMVKAPPAAMAAARQMAQNGMPARRQMPVAPTAPMIQPGAMKKGGFVKGGEGMIKSSGALGIKGNKNLGEKNGKPTTATKTGNVRFKRGGEVNCYADGGPAAPTQSGALNQMAQQQRDPMAAAMAQMQARGPSQGQQIPADVIAGYNAAMQQPQGQLYRATLADGRSVVGERQTIDPKFADVMRSMGLPPGGGLPAGATMTPVNQPQPNMQQPGMGGGMSPQQFQALAAQFAGQPASQGLPSGQQGLGQAAMGGAMPSQQLQNLAQTAYNAYRAGQSPPTQQMPPQQMPQHAPMGMGMGQFGPQTPQPPQPQRAANPNGFQMAMNQMRGR